MTPFEVVKKEVSFGGMCMFLNDFVGGLVKNEILTVEWMNNKFYFLYEIVENACMLCVVM